MKRILFSILFFLCLGAQKSLAQGNLQFNQVKTITGSIASQTVGQNNSTVLTVPANKVWKVEKIITSSAPYVPNGNYFATLMGLKINGLECNYFYSGEKQAEVPIWLKAGDTFSLVLSSGSNINYCISLIEFNIVP